MTVTYTVDQEMIADNDTLVITDPCYIMRDEDWEHFLDMEFSETAQGSYGLDNYLRRYHNFGELVAGDTGIGDWNNVVYNTNTDETVGKFCADAGMVICCTASDLKNYGADFDEIKRLASIGCAAIIENYSGHIRLCYETTPSSKLAVLEAVGDENSDDINWSTEHLADN